MAGVKGKKRKRKRPTEDKAQSARFIETAKRLQADEDGGAFERALDIFAPKRKKP
jgi:hypothetical protein